MLASFWQDARFAIRVLARHPVFTLAAIATLALGIGVNSAMFSLVDAVLLRPLPFGHPESLVSVYERRQDATTLTVSGHEYVAWRDRSHAFDGMAIYDYRTVNLTTGGEPELVEAMAASANLFGVLQIRPQLGRGFVAGEDSTPAARVAVLSSHLWHDRFGAQQDVIGREIRLDGEPFTVVGVMPPRGDLDPDLWIPFDVSADAQKVGKHSSLVTARLAPGATVAGAERDLDRIAVELEREYPAFNVDHRVHVVPITRDVLASARGPLLVLWGAVTFILLIACVNVAHLLLTRAAARHKEVAIRTALGASRRRMLSQLVTESVVLAVGGGAVGLLLALWTVRLLPRIQSVHLVRLGEATVNGRVLVATAVLALLTGVASGLLPAVRGSRLDVARFLGEGVRTSRVHGRVGDAFMVSQVALALVLLVGAGLMLRSLERLLAVDPGFHPQGALVMDLALPAARYARPELQAQAISTIVSRVRQLPGVTAVGTTTRLPLTACCDVHPVTIEGAPPPAPGQELSAALSVVGGDYFRATGIPIRHGRSLTGADARRAVPLIRYFEQQPYPRFFTEPQPAAVAVINEAMARAYWPGRDPVGLRFRILYSPWITVVGVAGNVRQTGLAAPSQPEMYLPASQEPRREMTLVVRTTQSDPLALAGSVRDAIHAIDAIPIQHVRTLDQVVRDSVGEPRFYAGLLATFAALALLLAVVGIYGVISYSVAQRTHEIGIRWALGARPADVLRLVLARAMSLTVLGVAIGIAGALALTRLLSGLLYDVPRDDPLTFAFISGAMLIVALVASWVPAARALRVDPSASLRE
ncbi:MAG TPA: ABC transporter permease [Gemmatimonadaceae bacterium]|nr:ABC transporter permease [Gemmatimonadaceae bacterium]